MLQLILLRILIVAKAYLCVQCLQCLKCENVIAPILCNGKATCDENEVCFIEKFKGFNEEILFNLGCRLNSKCSIQGGVDVCTSCCDSDLCNYAGCGETAPANAHRPVCLSCKQSRTPAKCDSISICEDGEVCHIEEIHQSGFTYYATGCMSEHLCRHFLTTIDIFGKRSAVRTDRSSVVTCASCCRVNLCNNNCSVAKSHSTSKEQSSLHNTTIVLSTSPTFSTFVETEMTTTSSRGDHKGRNFYLMFINNEDVYRSEVKLIITTSNTATVTIYSPYQGFNKTILITKGVARVNLPGSIDAIYTGLSSRGIHVFSDKPISVVGFSHVEVCCVALAFNAFPADKEGQSYKVQTIFNSPGDRQDFGIVSTYSDTSVVITSTLQQPLKINGKTLKTHDNVTINLARLQCYYYVAPEYLDISGLKISSNKPVMVFSGNSRIVAPTVDVAVESIPPEKTWGKHFIVPLIQAVTIYLKILLKDPNNVVNITGNNYSRSFTSSDKIQVELLADSYSVSAKHPVLVFVVTKYINDSISPFMSIIPAITQFSNDYIVAGPSALSGLRPYRNYLSIVIDKKYKSGITMNGNVIQPLRQSSIALNNVSYSCMIVDILGSIAYKIDHVQSHVVFGAIVYGYGDRDAYGYPAGLRL